MELSFKLEIFEGPLDLLLHLIKKNKVSIYDIPIVEITEQYMEYLSKMSEMDLEISSEFLVMASQLLYIKSKMLLPKHEEEEEEDPRKNLADRLIEYKKMKEAGEKLKLMQFSGYLSFYKEAQDIKGIEMPKKRLEAQSMEKLTSAFLSILEKAQRKAPPPASRFDGIVGREVVSVKTKTTQLLKRMKKGSRLSFKKAFDGVKSKSEAVSQFLAILELLRMGVLEVETHGEDILLKRMTDTEGEDLEKIEESYA